ncbi:MAG: hypothetical protein IKB38_09905 [Clostridia bacterium]|nr:hypothetical protein [Clostridia bacterium]
MSETPILRYTETDRGLFLRTVGNGAKAVFLYSGNVLSDGKLQKYSNGARTVAYGGELYVPCELFTRFLGAECDAEKAALVTGTGEYRYRDDAKEKDGTVYLPAEAACGALGISARIYDKKLLVIADDDVLSALSSDAELLNSAMYTVTGEYSTDRLTSADFTQIKNKWRKILVGDASTNDSSDPDVALKLENIAKAARSVQGELNRAPDRVILFGAASPEASSDLTTQYNKIWTMAQGFATFGTQTYRDEALRDDILDSLSWMYENMYGESIIEGRGWRDARAFNWWDWFVGGVIPLTRTMLVMEEFLSMETKDKYLKCFRWIMTVHRVGYRKDFASSRIPVATLAALLLEDKELLYNEFLDYDLLLEESGAERGKYPDHVCWTHNYPYNMMYGFCAIDRTFFVGSVLSGTAAEFKSPKEYGMYDLVKYMYEAACYKGQGFVIFNGRANMGSEFASGITIITKVLPMIGCFGDDEDEYLKHMVKRLCSTPEIVAGAKRACSLYNLSVLNSVLEDESVSGENDYQLTYAWFTADRIAHHRDDYAFMLAMSSERHPSYESINSANRRGWYTGDGALYFYTNTDRHSFDGANFITNPEITRRIPGTTTDAREMKEWAYRSGWKSPKAYAGCMDLFGSFGIGAFEYSAYHYDGHEADGTVDDGYGGGFVYYENDLEAKKSYFFFDGEVVCLGAGISSTMNSPVRTTVEHRRLVKPLGGELISVAGEKMPDGEFTKTGEIPFICIEDFAGYVFPSGGEVEVKRYIRRESTKLDGYFTGDINENTQFCAEINMLHGENPKDASYAYVILPYADADKTAAYAKAPEIEIIRNAPECQAVRKPSSGVTSIAFYGAGECAGVKTDIPAIVMLGERDGVLTFSVCDPTQKAERGVFTVEGKLELVSAYPEMTVTVGENSSVIEADLTSLAGKNLVAEFKIK